MSEARIVPEKDAHDTISPETEFDLLSEGDAHDIDEIDALRKGNGNTREEEDQEREKKEEDLGRMCD